MFTDPALPTAARICRLPLVVFRSRASGWVEGAWRRPPSRSANAGRRRPPNLMDASGGRIFTLYHFAWRECSPASAERVARPGSA